MLTHVILLVHQPTCTLRPDLDAADALFVRRPLQDEHQLYPSCGPLRPVLLRLKPLDDDDIQVYLPGIYKFTSQGPAQWPSLTDLVSLTGLTVSSSSVWSSSAPRSLPFTLLSILLT